MGLCSSTAAGKYGNIRRCLDPKEVCDSKVTGRRNESSLQQITVRGPLHIIPVPRGALGLNHSARGPDEKTESSSGGGGHYTAQSSHTLVEVPVEVAVAIALASFMVGAMSTGVLWYLHNRALQAKAVSRHPHYWLQHNPTYQCRPQMQNRLTTSSGETPGGDATELHAMISLDSSTSPRCRQTNSLSPSNGDHNGNVNCVTCPLVT